MFGPYGLRINGKTVVLRSLTFKTFEEPDTKALLSASSIILGFRSRRERLEMNATRGSVISSERIMFSSPMLTFTFIRALANELSCDGSSVDWKRNGTDSR